MNVSLEQLNHLENEAFVSILGGIFEHSPWVAEGAISFRPFSSVENLHQTMVTVVNKASEAKQLELIRAHPDLAGKAARAGQLTASSSKEQAGAGLSHLSDEEYQEFHRLNDAYKDKFAFPFILAVKGHTQQSILEAFSVRLNHSAETERKTALEQIARIAWFRLEDLVHG
ncbi:MAG: 2-oxo-4-hydroxy-4-carboxy-5-ureidoimidazoline decarboxylase [Trueperaceae bacterium]|nr:2-oxo-4-hydroxy-4-carboxy-5-ureidoimidazoline decarboxylase [Trueperaceae bacterium]